MPIADMRSTSLSYFSTMSYRCFFSFYIPLFPKIIGICTAYITLYIYLHIHFNTNC